MSRHQRYFREARKAVAAAASSDKMLQLLEQVINSEADSDIVPIMRAFDRGGVAGALKEVKKRLGDEAVYELRRRGFKASASATVSASSAEVDVDDLQRAKADAARAGLRLTTVSQSGPGGGSPLVKISGDRAALEKLLKKWGYTPGDDVEITASQKPVKAASSGNKLQQTARALVKKCDTLLSEFDKAFQQARNVGDREGADVFVDAAASIKQGRDRLEMELA